jgi:hypothetical protein
MKEWLSGRHVPTCWWRLSPAETARWSGLGLLAACIQGIWLNGGTINIPIGVFLIIGTVLVVVAHLRDRRQ